MKLSELLQKAADWWYVRPAIQRSALIGVVAVVLLVGFVQCVRAEPASAESNYQVVMSPSGQTAFCPLQDGVPVSGVVSLCLVGQKVGDSMWMVNGTAVYCAVTGMQNDRPFWSCGGWEAITKTAQGI
jgi:hypothetical protein